MTKYLVTANLALGLGLFALSSCATQDEMMTKPDATAKASPAKAAPAKAAAAKAKVERARGNIGLLDDDKDYIILVTKEGKLITMDFDDKTKVTKVSPKPGKIEDIGLGSSATVEYVAKGDKLVASKLEYKAKGGRD